MRLKAHFQPASARRPRGTKSPGIAQYGSRTRKSRRIRDSVGSCDEDGQSRHQTDRWPDSAPRPNWANAAASLEAVVTPAALKPKPMPASRPQVGTPREG